MACGASPAYALAVSTLVGREPELAEIAAFLEADVAEAALAIVGEPGIGKTAVWEGAGGAAARARPRASAPRRRAAGRAAARRDRAPVAAALAGGRAAGPGRRRRRAL